jgi:hypothetical protein
MSTTLTGLIPDLYAGLDVVSRELVGMIPAVTLDPSVARAALNQNVLSPVAPAAAVGNITPGVTPPDDGNQTIANVAITISKARRSPIRWTGEQERQANNGVGVGNVRVNQIAQSIRALVNEMENDLAGLHTSASRAVGAASTPFATAGNFMDAANVRRALVDNGAPTTDLQLVLDTAAGANLRGLQSRQDIQGDMSLLRQGVLLDHSGLMIRESGQIRLHTAGTAASSTTNNAGYAVGATVITLASAGTGTFLVGDAITFAGDANIYILTAGDADVSGGGTITLAAPGLRQAIPASATNITRLASTRRSLGFARTAIVLATRMPSLPESGDMAIDRTTITDPRSGMSFEVAMYPQYRQMQWEISAAWGFAAIKPEHIVTLLG